MEAACSYWGVPPLLGLLAAERLRQAVAAELIFHPQPINGEGLTVSLGVASWTPQAGAVVAVDPLLQLADECLYEAKHQGRDRVVAAALRADAIPGGSAPEGER